MQGLQRGLAVLKAFGGGSAAPTIAEIAERTGLARAVVRRCLLTLEALGYVVRNRSGFVLTPRVLELGSAYLSTIDVRDVAEPFIEKVVETLHDTCNIAVLDGHEIVYVARVVAKRLMSVNLVLGSRLPAHSTALGKVLLAYSPASRLDQYFATVELRRLTRRTICDESELRRALQEVRRRGWAIADQETEDGVRAIAAPIFNRKHEVEAAINVGTHTSRVSLKEMREKFLPVLLDAARQISRVMGANMSG